MRIFKQSLSSPEYQTQATLTCYLKDLDPRNDHQQLPAVIYVPGGSYTHIQTEQAENICLAFAARHYQCFVLRYSFEDEQTPLLPAPLIELGKSIALIRENAAQWQVDPSQIIPMGFSVGGHVVSLYNDYWRSDWVAKQTQVTADQLKPNAAILGYPVIDLQMGFPDDQHRAHQWAGDDLDRFAAQKHVNDYNAPTFTWVTSDDPFVPVANSLAYSTALAAHNIAQELHVFRHGPHGMALATAATAWKPDADQPHVAHWLTLADEWLKETL